jgi:hypothetical protein
MLTHGLAQKDLSYCPDESLGVDVKLAFSKSMTNLLNGLIGSAQTPLGFYAGEDHKFQTGYKANLPGMLASMRLLNWKREYLRVKPRLPQGVSPVAYYDLQETFNAVSGLKSEEQKGWHVDCFKAILNSCIKVNNTGFPGGWIHQNRVKNGVKSDFALIQALGWTEKICNKSKLLEVLFTAVDEESTIGNDGKRKVTKRTLVNISRDKRQFSLPEFRTGVAMLLPRVNPVSPLKIQDQVKADSLSVRNQSTLTSAMDKSMIEAVDVLNDAYTLRVSVNNSKSKTKPVHYQAMRGRLLSASSKLKYTDAKGHSYKGLFDLPESLLKQFTQLFPYSLKTRQGAAEAAIATDDVTMANIGGPSSSTAHQDPVRRTRITKGQAAEKRRESGRLARKNAVRVSRGAAVVPTRTTTRAAARLAASQREGSPSYAPRSPPPFGGDLASACGQCNAVHAAGTECPPSEW